MPSTDVLIAGGGAAGLMCAIVAGRRGRRVVVLEHNAQIGRKILISGGGRCNFANLHTRPEHFHSANPHFAKSALARCTPRDFLDMVERHGIPWHEKTAGQLFCDRSARDIVGMLLKECAAAGVRVEAGCAVKSIGGKFQAETTAGEFRAESLVIATGGLSIPKIGATPFGYQVARQFGLGIVECRPALVPWIFSGFGDLAGVAAEAEVGAGGQRFRGRILFTHRGLSGPAALQASSYWRPGEMVTIDLSVDGHLPKRLARRFEGQDLTKWTFRPDGTEGYEKAEVTAGGVDTDELSSKTMEARKVPGLYFIGEVVDVTGHLGGFNFQWAWASGHAAGEVA